MKTLLLITIFSSNVFKDYRIEFIECYNGDTCKFNIYLGMGVILTKQVVRLCDINAPEKHNKQIDAAEIAKQRLTILINMSDNIYLRIPQKHNCNDSSCDKKSKYGHWLGYIIVDNKNVNQILLDEKLVEEWKDKCI